METVISSAANKHVRQVVSYRKKRKERDRDGVFIAEGERLVTEAPAEDLLELYVSASYHAAMSREAERFFARHAAAQVVSDEVFAKMSDTKTPQGILAVVRQRRMTLEGLLNRQGGQMPGETAAGVASAGSVIEAVETGKVVAVLEEIQDPGNLGTILRTCEAAGTGGVILTGDTVDPYGPKAVRATMGSIFRVPVVRTRGGAVAASTGALGGAASTGAAAAMASAEAVTDTVQVLRALRAKGYTVAAADASGETAYTDYDWTRKTALVIGNEANGLSAETKRAADVLLRIPMAGKNESLNAAVSAAVMLFEAARQRRGARGRASQP